MRFLIDMPVSPYLADWLKKEGYEAIHVSKIGMHAAADIEILQFAKKEDRIIITADLDFSRLIAMLGAASPSIILFRGGNYSEEEMQRFMDHLLHSVSPKEIKQAIIVLEKHRIRRTRLPLERNI